MPHRTFTLSELAVYLHLSASDVERLVREAGLPHDARGGKILFRRGEVDAWASKRILSLPDHRLDAYHEKTMRGTSSLFPEKAVIPELLVRSGIALELTSKTRSSVLRDMVSLADATGKVLDARALLQSVEAREALCSTALPGGLALLHAQHHDAYLFETSFLLLGRTIQGIPFGAPDRAPTRLFFLVCCHDDRIHLHTLARLCLVATKTDILEQLYVAPDIAAAYDALLAAEQSVLFPQKSADN